MSTHAVGKITALHRAGPTVLQHLQADNLLCTIGILCVQREAIQQPQRQRSASPRARSGYSQIHRPKRRPLLNVPILRTLSNSNCPTNSDAFCALGESDCRMQGLQRILSLCFEASLCSLALLLTDLKGASLQDSMECWGA